MTDILSSTPAARPFFNNRESYENRESFGEPKHSTIRWIATIWFHIPEVIHCEHDDSLK
jgi:hypothetical protein